jgi:hypothetical protein
VLTETIASRESSLVRFATFDRLLGVILFLVIIAACGLTPMQTDTWWQLRAGRDMWVSRSVLLTDVYSHTAYGAFWPNHEWLSELFFYAMYRAGGLPLLTLSAAALIAGGWAFTWALCQGGGTNRFLWTAAALVSASVWWEPRPHAFSLLFLMATVFLLVRQRYRWLPLVFVMWANCHGGVLLGFVVLAAGLGIQTLVQPRTWLRAPSIFLACLLATTATPLGLAFWTEIPRSLARIRLYPLDEWQRPGVTEASMLPFWIIAVVLCGALIRNRRRLAHAKLADATLYACAVVLLPMALSAVRHVGPFLMVAVPALTSLLYQGDVTAPVDKPRPRLNLAIMSIAATALAGTLVWAYRNEIPRLRWHPVPALALQALQQCPDNLYNRYDEGGYLLWFAPDRKVFLDGRQDPFGRDLVLEHIEMETRGRRFEPTFARHAIRCAYLPLTSPIASQLLTAGWKPLYRDARWIVLRGLP